MSLVPFSLQPARNLDLVVGVDSSADVSDWPNGTAIRETFLRVSGNPDFNDVSFPTIPTQATFVNRGLNTRPTFFGCNRSSLVNVESAGNNTVSPLIVYLPSYPYSALANSSTFKLSYSDNEVQALLDNSVNSATLGGLANAGNIKWSTCLACAALERGFERSNTARPQVCQTCFDQYCWDGISNDTVPADVSQLVSWSSKRLSARLLVRCD